MQLITIKYFNGVTAINTLQSYLHLDLSFFNFFNLYYLLLYHRLFQNPFITHYCHFLHQSAASIAQNLWY